MNMSITVRSISLKIRLVAGIITAMVAGAGALAAYSDLAPATRGYAKEIAKRQTDAALSIATARIGNLQRESNETRLQINKVRMDHLRADKFSREQQLQTTSDPAMRQLLQRRLDEITDDLADVNKERERLRMPSP